MSEDTRETAPRPRGRASTTRRGFLYGASGLAVAAVGYGAVGWGKRLPTLNSAEGGTGNVVPSELALPERFTVPLPIMPVHKPVSTADGADVYEVTQRAADVEILPGTRTTVWGYEGRFPGPTFEARSNRKVIVRQRNELPRPVSTHLHGGVTPPDFDGYPTDLVLPAGYELNVHTGAAMGGMDRPGVWDLHDQTKTYEYPLPQQATTLWYHDHRMDFSAPQVWRGLAGMFLVRDDEEQSLPLPAGDKELPLMICDRSFTRSGQFSYPSVDPSLEHTRGVRERYMNGVLGDVILVNGAPWPVAEVANTRYRLRLLNASNARRYRLRLDPPPKRGPAFVQIGSDNGLLGAPRELDAVPIASAERYDVVVDFSQYPVGSEVTLVNELSDGNTGEVMRFRVSRSEKDESSIPQRLSAFERLDPAQAVRTRTFQFRLSGTPGNNAVWTINGRPFNPSESLADPRYGTVERWRFTSDFHHPVHTHLVHFQVLSRDGGAPDPHEGGWKDTVEVNPFQTVDVLVKVTGVRGRGMIHCHNLEHEDMAMMGNFRIV